VLLLYNGQRAMAGRFEVIVVNNGSTDDTRAVLEAVRLELQYPLRCFELGVNSGGASPARNVGIEQASGRVLFITGDDILPDESLLHEHWSWQTQRHPEPHVGVLGLVKWAAELEPTPFMRWLDEYGTQFDYGALTHGDAVGHGYLYTSNFSIKREFVQSTGERFDERLCLFEDCEWGLRLAKKGFEMRYNSHAVGQHLHHTTLDSSLRRTQASARAAAILRKVNREEFDRATNGLFQPANRRKLAFARVVLHPLLLRLVYTPLARWCERRVVVDRLYAAVHSAHLLEGLDRSESGRWVA
jgi:GT2 family glycosyltransferase